MVSLITVSLKEKEEDEAVGEGTHRAQKKIKTLVPRALPAVHKILPHVLPQEKALESSGHEHRLLRQDAE